MARPQTQLEALPQLCDPCERADVANASLPLRVPSAPKEFTPAASSKGKKVLIPSWVDVDGVRFTRMPIFPNTQGKLEFHAGAQGCVAAYESTRPVDAAARGLPRRIALKCVPFGAKNRTGSSPWASEWAIHKLLRSLGADAAGAVVRCLGGVAAPVARTAQVYFALELVDTDLFTVVEHSALIPDFGRWILRALLSTARALHALHARGVIYCDLKPENVLVRVSDASARFGDFDRSCVPGRRIGVVGGTKGYYSPDRMRSSSRTSREDDAWALGVLLLIGATTAASPYLEFTPDTVHNFDPARYLRRYSRCGWPEHITERIAVLAEGLLEVDAARRMPVSCAADELAAVVRELSAPAAPPPRMVAASPQQQWAAQRLSASCSTASYASTARGASPLPGPPQSALSSAGPPLLGLSPEQLQLAQQLLSAQHAAAYLPQLALVPQPLLVSASAKRLREDDGSGAAQPPAHKRPAVSVAW